MNLVSNVSEFKYDSLIANVSFPIQTAAIALASGNGLLVRGSVLGKTADNSIILVGGETTATAEFILAEDVDTGDTAGSTVNAIVYVSGAFNRNALVFDGTATANDCEEDLKKFGIYLKAVL
ncbi:head decoration protein [Lysinibacillus telephonicus]|uniref:head decoration protein n=1 Tax=Lysinibacillus telephonicus TaxID=1714840 RepID=UPI003B9E4EEF